VIALIASIGISIAAPDKDAIMAKEKEAWQTFKDKNAEGFKKVIDKTSASLRRRHLRHGEGIVRHEKSGT